MSNGQPSLDDLRSEIDRLDDQIHDLIMHRIAVAERIAQVKVNRESDRPAIRPGREAAVLRRIVTRHRGSVPSTVIARMWREMISAICRMQAPMKIAVCAPEKSVGYWDLARSHYGSSTPMTLHHSPQIVLRMVSEDASVIGILPAPQQDDDKPWWPHLATSVENAPKVIARLPFHEDIGGRFEDLSSMAVARIEPEPSGDDISLVTAIADEEISRAKLRELLDSAGFKSQEMKILSHRDEGGSNWFHMIEVPDFVAPSDARLAAMESEGNGNIRSVFSLGAFAAPTRRKND